VKPVLGCDALVADYIGKGLEVEFHPPFTAIGFTRDEKELCFGALYNCWNGSNIEITLYGPKAGNGLGNRLILATIFRYPFRQLKATRLTAKTKRSNATMKKIMPRMGFVFEGTQKRFFGPNREDDALLFAMFPEQAEKWMR
jgi:RimJ/RimL family protein N-acetyltransferase